MQFEKDQVSPFKDLFNRVRSALLATPGVVEAKKEKITAYSYNGSGLCHVRTMPEGVDVGFLKGAMMQDEFGMLHGETKRMRVLSLQKFQQAELAYYLEQALKLNA